MGNKQKSDTKQVVLGQLGMILMRKFLLIEFINFKMSDYFETDILKKEFQDVIENALPKVLECGLCKKYSCKWHKLFLVSCNQCREARCLSCVTFKSSVEILIKTLDSDGKTYVQKFITDFFKISNETLQHLFNV